LSSNRSRRSSRGSISRRSGTRALRNVDGRTRNWISRISTSIDVKEDSRVSLSVSTRECNFVSWVNSSRSTDSNFGASDVRLSSSQFESFVESDQFRSKKIISGSNISWKLDSQLSFVRSEFIDTPFVGCLVVTIFENLEPDSTTSGFGFCQID